jgi:hypothetical protein
MPIVIPPQEVQRRRNVSIISLKLSHQKLILNKAWYRNSYVEAYWEIEDTAIDVYEMALTPIIFLAGILAVYFLVVAIGVGFVLLGHLILRSAGPTGNPTLAPSTNYPLTGTLELSSIGAAIFALPVMFAWRYIPMDPRWGKLGILFNILLKILLAVFYGSFSGATGSGILLATNEGILPAAVATTAGAVGGLTIAPPFIFITLTLLYWQRKRCMVPLSPLAPSRTSMV